MAIQGQAKLIPRYVRRAYWAGKKKQFNKAVQRALADGWTLSDLVRGTADLPTRVRLPAEVK